MKERQTQRNTWTHRKAGTRCTGLSNGETPAPRKPSVIILREVTREVGLLHTAKQGDGVSYIQWDQGDRFSEF